MPDINYVIGAKDNASKTLGDVGTSLNKLDLSFKTLAKSAAVFTIASAAIRKVSEAIRGLHQTAVDSTAAFNRQTEAIRMLGQAMELNGGGAVGLKDKYSALADELERTLNIEAETILEGMKLAATLGVQNDQLDDVTIAAIGLAEAMDIDLADAMKKARLAQEGHFESFNKILPRIKDMATDEQRLAAIQELAAKGLAMKTEANKSAVGETLRMRNSIDNLKKAVGGLLSPFQQVIHIGIRGMADAMTNILIPVVERVTMAFANWRTLILHELEVVINRAIMFVTAMEVYWGNLPKIFDIMGSSIALQLIAFVENIKWAFTSAITLTQWFNSNFLNFFRDIFSAALVVALNFGKKLVAFFSSIWTYILTGGDKDAMIKQLGETMGGSLLDGFKSRITDLPTIATRALTDDEKSLKTRIGVLAGDLAKEFNDKMNARRIKLGLPPLKLDEFKLKGVGGLDDLTKGGKDPKDALQVVEGRLLTRGPAGKKTLGDVVDVAEKIYATAQKTASNTEEIKRQGLYDQNIGKTLILVETP